MITRTIVIGAICIAGVFNFAAEPQKSKGRAQFKEFTYTFDLVDYQSINAPVFSTSRTVIFKPVTKREKDTRFKNLTRALELHEQEKPVGWAELVKAIADEPDQLQKLKLANSIINKIPYKDGTDGSYYHPAKLYRQGGVCKDMAVAKYLLLKEAGYRLDLMRLAVLSPRIDKPESAFHVVLVAQANGKDYVLDLLPAYLAEQERAKARTTKDKQIKTIREAGLDLDSVTEKELLNPKGFYTLESYVSERGLVWAGNEFGSREQF